MENNTNGKFEGISKDRDDGKCLNCGGGHLSYSHAARRLEHCIQSIWKCVKCGNDVVCIDEDCDQDCPLCGTPGMFTKSQIESMGSK